MTDFVFLSTLTLNDEGHCLGILEFISVFLIITIDINVTIIVITIVIIIHHHQRHQNHHCFVSRLPR